MTAPILPDSRGVGRAHRHYEQWFVGTGAQTEFLLNRTYEREEDVEVFVDGLKMRPKSRGTAHDFELRGLTPGYAGDRNAVRMAVAPALNDNVCVRVVSA